MRLVFGGPVGVRCVHDLVLREFDRSSVGAVIPDKLITRIYPYLEYLHEKPLPKRPRFPFYNRSFVVPLMRLLYNRIVSFGLDGLNTYIKETLFVNGFSKYNRIRYVGIGLLTPVAFQPLRPFLVYERTYIIYTNPDEFAF